MNDVLLVEDEKPLLEKMEKNIEWVKNGYRVYTASNGEKALNFLRNNNVDILVTDIKMPKISGIELIKNIRRLNLNTVPIIISGYAEFEYARESIRLNVAEYILKPFRSFKLLKVVNGAREQLREYRRKQQELKELSFKLNKILAGEIDMGVFSELVFKNEKINLYEKQAVILNNEMIFQDLRRGKKEDIIADVNNLINDIQKNNFDRENFYMILNNIVLLTFKCLKDMGYDVEEVVKYLNKKSNRKKLREIKNTNPRDWLLNFFFILNQLITDCTRGEDQLLIVKVKQVVNKNYSKGITLGELADRFNISCSNLSRLFYKYTGKKFSTYMDNIRLNKAKELLKTTDHRIYEIADKIGFEDPYYFSSWFKKRAGVSPTTYRDNLLLFD